MADTNDRALERHEIGRELIEDIHRSLGRRTAPAGTLRGRAEDALKRGGVRAFGVFRERPSLGVILFGGLAIALADLVGAGELAMGIGIGYAAWQVLRKGEPVGKALEEARRVGEV